MVAAPVRVGTAVDTVAQAGRPKTVTGFQTHTTPVLLSVGERAELGTEKYIPGGWMGAAVLQAVRLQSNTLAVRLVSCLGGSPPYTKSPALSAAAQPVLTAPCSPLSRALSLALPCSQQHAGGRGHPAREPRLCGDARIGQPGASLAAAIYRRQYHALLVSAGRQRRGHAAVLTNQLPAWCWPRRSVCAPVPTTPVTLRASQSRAEEESRAWNAGQLQLPAHCCSVELGPACSYNV
jgi:hypothetical protein